MIYYKRKYIKNHMYKTQKSSIRFTIHLNSFELILLDINRKLSFSKQSKYEKNMQGHNTITLYWQIQQLIRRFFMDHHSHITIFW